MPISFDELRAFMLALPGVIEQPSYGQPSLRTPKRLLVRLLPDGDSVALLTTFDEREMLMEAAPEAFYLTDHYRKYPAVLARLSQVEAGTLKRLMMQAWRGAATRRQLQAFEAQTA
jgi:hypothetical protein